MPKADMTITLPHSLAEVWDFFSHLDKIGPCLRFVEKAEPGDGEAVRWKIRSPMSGATKTPFLEVVFTEKKEKEVLAWQAKGEHLQWSGEVKLRSLGENETEVKVTLEVQGLGGMAPIINATSAPQVPGHLRFFFEQVKSRLTGS